MVFQRASLFIEDTGLLEGVLALGYIPHPHCPIITTSSQQALFTAPATCDDLSGTERLYLVPNSSYKRVLGFKLARDHFLIPLLTNPALVSLELDEGALPQVPRHVSKGLRPALVVVAVMGGQRADQLLGSPLAMLWGKPGRQAAGRQSVGQLQGAYSGGIMGRMGIQMRN